MLLNLNIVTIGGVELYVNKGPRHFFMFCLFGFRIRTTIHRFVGISNIVFCDFLHMLLALQYLHHVCHVVDLTTFERTLMCKVHLIIILLF